jgi:hypothetical protein
MFISLHSSAENEIAGKRLDIVSFHESSCRRKPASIFVAVTLHRLDTGFRRYDRMFAPNPGGIVPPYKARGTRRFCKGRHAALRQIFFCVLCG